MVLNQPFIRVYYIELPIEICGFRIEIHGFPSEMLLWRSGGGYGASGTGAVAARKGSSCANSSCDKIMYNMAISKLAIIYAPHIHILHTIIIPFHLY